MQCKESFETTTKFVASPDLAKEPCQLVIQPEKTSGTRSASDINESAAESETSSSSQSVSEYVYFPRGFRTSWPATRTNQVINIIYFGACALVFYLLAALGIDLPGVTITCCSIVALSCFFLVKYRSFLSTDDELPLWCRNFLRAFALTAPFILFCGTVLMTVHSYQVREHHVFAPKESFAMPVIDNGPQDLAGFERELKIADQSYFKDDYPDAIIHYEKALAFYPKSESALTKLASSYYRYYPDRRLKTVEYATQIIEVNPKNFDAHLYLAESYNDLKNYNAALPHAEFLNSEDPKFGRGWAALTKASLNLGHLETALAAANQHLRLHPNEYDALEDRAQVFKAMGRTKEAQADFEKLKKM